MDNLRDFVKKGLKENIGLSDWDEILAEAKSAEEWWNSLPGKRKRKVCEALGLSKGKDRSLFSKLSKGVQSEVEAYYSKHRGKVEQTEIGNEGIDETRELRSMSEAVVKSGWNRGIEDRKLKKFLQAVDKAAGAVRVAMSESFAIAAEKQMTADRMFGPDLRKVANEAIAAFDLVKLGVKGSRR
jgi:hypothetical protein